MLTGATLKLRRCHGTILTAASAKKYCSGNTIAPGRPNVLWRDDVNRIRFCYACGKELRYLSHLDMLRLFQRSLRRSGLPLAYTRGFSPRPRLSLAAPLPVGATASRELGELYLAEPVTAPIFCRSLGEQLPRGLTLKGALAVSLDEPPLAALVNAALYRAAWAGKRSTPDPVELQGALDQLLAQPVIMVPRLGKGGLHTEIDVRPFIISAELLPQGDTLPLLRLLLQVGSKGGLSPHRFLELLPLEGAGAAGRLWELHRQGLYIYTGDLIDPFSEGCEKDNG